MPDLGIGEGIAALLGGGGLDALLGGGAAAAETGLATVGAGAAEAGGAAAGAGGLADIVGTGTALAGGATGLEGTALAGGVTGGLDALLGGGAAGGALGTAEAFMGAPAASGFNPTAVGGASAFSDVLPAGSAPTSGVSTPGAPGSNVFNTGTAAVPGVNPAGAPSAVPAGGGASAISAPAGVNAPVDPTAAAAGATPAAAGATPAAPPSSIESLLGKAGGGVLDSLTKNPLGVALGAGGLGYNILKGQQDTKNQAALTADAKTATANSSQLMASGEDLQKYLTNGTLPPAYQTQVDQAISDAKATAVSNAAGQGLSTDPTQNTALAAQLAKIDSSRGAMQSQVAAQLFSSGSSLVAAGQGAAGLSGQLYTALVNNDTAAAANTGKAIATLAAALNGKAQNTIGKTDITVQAA